MIEKIRGLVQRHKNRGVVIDTNLLLLYVIGLSGVIRIQDFKRTNQFTDDDFRTISHFVKVFGKILTTPNILTEVNSLSNQLKNHQKPRCYDSFNQCLQHLFEERYLESTMIGPLRTFSKFGLTDAGTIQLAEEQHLILTDDFQMANYLESNGRDV